MGGRPKPGWLVAIADNMETNSTMQEKGMTSSQQSRDMFSGQSASQEVQTRDQSLENLGGWSALQRAWRRVGWTG